MNEDQATGILLGLAVGDAVGTTVEFKQRGTFPEVQDMVGGGPFGLEVGQWTDDTSMALCLGDSLIARAGWSAEDCMNRFVNWRDYGYNSCTGTCFDIGITTSLALDRYLSTGDPYAGSTDPKSSGNGGIMRLAPAVIAAGSQMAARRLSVDQSRTTHASDECLEYVSLFCDLLWTADTTAVEKAPSADTVSDEISSSGYVVHTFEAAVWSVRSTETFRDAILKAANLGDDADTVAAVTGQIAGRIYGASGIPKPWLDKLAWRDQLFKMADDLLKLKLM